MGRREEIESAAAAHSRTITPAGVGIDIQKQSDFIAGALWADTNYRKAVPSEYVCKKIKSLLEKFQQDKSEQTYVEYIKKHWDDSID